MNDAVGTVGLGGAVTVIVVEAAGLWPPAFDARSVTVYVPAANVCWGFCAVDVVPSPKFHAHDVGDPVDVSVNCTFSGRHAAAWPTP